MCRIVITILYFKSCVNRDYDSKNTVMPGPAYTELYLSVYELHIIFMSYSRRFRHFLIFFIHHEIQLSYKAYTYYTSYPLLLLLTCVPFAYALHYSYTYLVHSYACTRLLHTPDSTFASMRS